MNTTNNIKVESGSTVGQINAGAINVLDNVVTNLSQTGHEDFGAALQQFTQAVINSAELSAETQKETLDTLRAVVEEAYKGKTGNASLFKLGLKTISTLVSAAHVLHPAWEHLRPFFEKLVSK